MGRLDALFCASRASAAWPRSEPAARTSTSALTSRSDFLDRVRPWAVVNAAGYVRVDDAELDAGNCFRINTEGGCVLADECGRLGIPVVAISSDLIFDGRKSE